MEPPELGVLCDVLWADPIDSESGHLDRPFIFNQNRGCSYTFGADALANFLQRNNLLCCIRAHEVQLEGFKMFQWKGKNFPQIITLFSAPNYCDSYNNKAAVIFFSVNLLAWCDEYPAVSLLTTPILSSRLYECIRLVNALYR